jgi:hypothetical protein
MQAAAVTTALISCTRGRSIRLLLRLFRRTGHGMPRKQCNRPPQPDAAVAFAAAHAHAMALADAAVAAESSIAAVLS